jgi:hypothetical protein
MRLMKHRRRGAGHRRYAERQIRRRDLHGAERRALLLEPHTPDDVGRRTRARRIHLGPPLRELRQQLGVI